MGIKLWKKKKSTHHRLRVALVPWNDNQIPYNLILISPISHFSCRQHRHASCLPLTVSPLRGVVLNCAHNALYPHLPSRFIWLMKPTQSPIQASPLPGTLLQHCHILWQAPILSSECLSFIWQAVHFLDFLDILDSEVFTGWHVLFILPNPPRNDTKPGPL